MTTTLLSLRSNELSEITTFKVLTPEGNIRLAELQKTVSSRLKEIDEAYDATIADLHAQHKAAVAEKKEIQSPWLGAKNLLSAEAVRWKQHCDAERARIEAEAVAQARAERDAQHAELLRQENEARFKHAELMAVAGDCDDPEVNETLSLEAHRVEIAMQQQDALRAAPLILAPVEVPKSAPGQRFTTSYDVSIIDSKLVPAMWLIPDEASIKAYVRSKKGKVEIPGVKITIRQTASAF